MSSDHLIFCKSDKSNTATAQNINEYIEKIEGLFSNEIFIQLTIDSTNKFNCEIKSLIKRCPNIFANCDYPYLTGHKPSCSLKISEVTRSNLSYAL